LEKATDNFGYSAGDFNEVDGAADLVKVAVEDLSRFIYANVVKTYHFQS
jgi:hypothetical protein